MHSPVNKYTFIMTVRGCGSAYDVENMQFTTWKQAYDSAIAIINQFRGSSSEKSSLTKWQGSGLTALWTGEGMCGEKRLIHIDPHHDGKSNPLTYLNPLPIQQPLNVNLLPENVLPLKAISHTPITEADNSEFIVAASNGDIHSVRSLLDKGIDINSIDEAGDFALGEAVWWGHEEIVKLLVDAGANTTLKNADGKTLIDMAIENGQGEIVRILERVKKDNLTKRNKKKSLNFNSNPRLKMLIKELNELIGLSSVKADVIKLVKLLEIEKEREAFGLVSFEKTMHTVFTGNPGVGKTTVARLLAQIYHVLGLTNGIFVETDRAGLVGGYLGQTALKTKAAIESAYGGVLFIDDAYRLTQDEHDIFGKEAVDTLLTEMENHRDDLIVIVAGYEQEMIKFVQSNSGLASRFIKNLHFEDYSPDELLLIFKYFAEQSDYKLTQATEMKLEDLFSSLYQKRTKDFGNARDVRKIFQNAVSNHANRIALTHARDEISLMTICPEDVPSS